MKHKHSELIKAWADGAEIQVCDTFTDDNRWRDVAGRNLNWHPEVVYRIKPKQEFLKYKVALFKSSSDNFFVDTIKPDMYDLMENHDKFIAWILDEQTVNLG